MKLSENIVSVDSLNNFKLLKPLTRYIKKDKGFIAGGCFKNIFNGTSIKDVDIFFQSMQDFYDTVSEYEQDELFIKLYENDNCIGFREKSTGVIVELIRKTFLEPVDTLEEFDFTITKFALQKHIEEIDGETNVTYTISHHKDFFEHLFLRRLVVDKDEIFFPIGTFNRMIRYVNYGYMPCHETKKKIVKAINDITYLNYDDISNNFYKEGFD